MKAVHRRSTSGTLTTVGSPGWCCSRKVGIYLLCALHTKLINFKAMTPNSAYEPSGSWDSIHVFETVERGRQAHYKLTSTVMLQLVTRKGSDGETDAAEKGNGSGSKSGTKHEGEVSLSGSMTRQVRPFSAFSRPGGPAHIELCIVDGTRLADSRLFVSHHEYRADD